MQNLTPIHKFAMENLGFTDNGISGSKLNESMRQSEQPTAEFLNEAEKLSL